LTTYVTEGRRSFVVLFAVLAMIAALLAIPATPVNAATAACPATIPSAGFTDLAGLSTETVESVNCIAFYDITKGTSATTYGPTANVTRWQMALFLTRQATAHGVTLPDPPVSAGYTDLTGLSADAVKAINQLAELGITKGTSATTYSPNNNVTRWQMALFLARLVTAAGVTLADPPADAGFTDLAGLSADAVKAINQLAAVSISKGTSATTFSPGEVVLRWQMALFLARTLQAGGVTPPGTVALSDAPQLVDVVFDADDADQTRLVFRFDEEIALVGDELDFLLVDVTGYLYAASEVEKGADDEVEAIFENDQVDVATVAAVHQGAVENIDGDESPAGSVGWKAFSVDGIDLPVDDIDGDVPDLVAVDSSSFDDDDDTIEVEFDQDMDAAGFVPGGFLFVEEGGTVWEGTAIADTDDEIVTVELLGNPDDDDADDLVRLFLEPNAATNDDGWGNAPHSVDINLNGENDDTPSLDKVDIDLADKEVTFTFNRSIVEPGTGETYDGGDFVLVSIAPNGDYALTVADPADLDRDTAKTVIWDVDGETALASLIVYAGIWEDGAAPLGTVPIQDFASAPDGELEVGHFVRNTYSFSAGTTAAPFPISASGDVTGLGNDYEIEVTFSQDLDAAETAGLFDETLLDMFEDGGALIDTPDWEAADADDEVVTYEILDGNDGFDELDDGDVALLSFEEGHVFNVWLYPSFPTSVSLD
jgi:hypothetical protein